MRKRIATNGGESDVHSRYWRKRLCWTQRAGATAKVKRATNRRERREGKAEIQEQL